jgi:hypothetical protein
MGAGIAPCGAPNIQDDRNYALAESYRLTKHLSLNGRSALPPTADIVSEKTRPRAHGSDCDVRFRSTAHWPDSSDEALNHVGVFQSYPEKID